MIRKPSTFRKALTVGLMLAITSVASLVQTATLAAGAPKAAGELALTGAVTLNGTPAISGATVFSDSTLVTNEGTAALNLGKLGRIEMGPHTQMVVRFGDTSIGGNLRAGRILVTAPTGIAVSVATTEGIASNDGKQPALLAVDANCAETQVLPLQGTATLAANNKVQPVATGETVSTAQQQGVKQVPLDAKRCPRLVPPKEEKLSRRGLAFLLFGLGGATAGIICAAACGDNPRQPVSGYTPGK